MGMEGERVYSNCNVPVKNFKWYNLNESAEAEKSPTVDPFSNGLTDGTYFLPVEKCPVRIQPYQGNWVLQSGQGAIPFILKLILWKGFSIVQEKNKRKKRLFNDDIFIFS